MKSMNKLLFWLTLILLAIPAGAQSIDGRWIFDKSVDYEGLTPSSTPPSIMPLQITNAQAMLPSNCTASLRQQSYYPGGPFQPLLKSGEDEPAIANFLSKQFNFSLGSVKVYYVADVGVTCNKLGSHFLVNDEKLIAIRGGSLFYAFKREKSALGAVGTNTALANMGGLKTSLLPFNLDTYNNTCLGSMPKRKGVPLANKKCNSAFAPYIVGPTSKVALLKLIGAHAYVKNGARGASEDYDNPVSHGLHPVALVFPPLKGVVLVRVDDVEGGDVRDAMSGAYLAIKDGKVTDQLNEGCSFNADYVCSAQGEPARYRLLETGKFSSMN
jgi:hypothetical protein